MQAFMMLIQADQTRALEYLSSCIEQVGSFNEILQLVIVELVHKVGDGDLSSCDIDCEEVAVVSEVASMCC